MGFALEIHVQIFTDKIIPGIFFKIIKIGCGVVVRAQLNKTSDEPIILKSGGGIEGMSYFSFFFARYFP